IVALAIPSLLDRIPERRLMLGAAAALPILLATSAPVMMFMGGAERWVALLLLWTLLGSATSAVLTPSARLLRRNSTEQNRTAVFAAQFSLSHACYLISYPLAGALGAVLGMGAIALVLSLLGAIALVLAVSTWKAKVQRAQSELDQSSAERGSA
ncbi:MAG: MFS transporter, partial [Microbacteriaceae bacterium]